MYEWVKRLFSGARAPAPAPRPVAPAPAPAPTLAPAATPSQLQFDQRDTVNENFYHWLFNTAESGGFDLTPVETQVIDALLAILQGQQSGAALVRRMPGLIPQLMQSLRSDSFSGAQLSRMISHDVVLVAAIIRLANSSFLGNGQHIGSVEHAVMVIGQEGLRQLITTVAFRPIIDVNSGPFTRSIAPRLWDQSERCAVASRSLAASLGADPFEGFLAGLLQNVGLIVSLRILDQSAKDGKGIGSVLFTSQLMGIARELAVNIGREWDFPPAVIAAVGEQGNVQKGARLSPLGQLLALSDYLSKMKLLAEAERLATGDPRLFRGLSPEALACFATLNAPAAD
ncbi:HDOD domain-containing protein [Massilia sp. TS11]|uniref:HDOD domain-containing protein n=1 Tax=Massilia sp. TS11 TaxID=2908003 RepID=UPI001EDB4CCF|nr:HDOD domain-containing protein [Massilia sp. TS11]MCG2583286.1 HDOD domain-containing protein [Massilia sp. TS11]